MKNLPVVWNILALCDQFYYCKTSFTVNKYNAVSQNVYLAFIVCRVMNILDVLTL